MVNQYPLSREGAIRHRGHTASTRDRVVLLFLAIAALLVVALVGNGTRNLYAGENEPLVQTITIRQGDTLWNLADKYGDPNQYMLQRVDALKAMNHLGNGVVLHEGQTLIVPVSAKSADL